MGVSCLEDIIYNTWWLPCQTEDDFIEQEQALFTLCVFYKT